MIEEYGTLSEEELIQEIIAQLEESEGIDPSDLDFKFEEDKLKITGSLQNEDELEILIGVLEDYVDPKDYRCEVELLEEGLSTGFGKSSRMSKESDEDDEDEEDEDYFEEEGLEEVEEDDLDSDDYEDEDEDEGNDEDKW
ncbi:MAG TPA: hypothetical protein DF383_11125 [Deltaproteobacteria bacterium]|nr:hypothetical protein [Deltaproteobacteria bacterium]